MLDSARRRHRQLRLLDIYGLLLTEHQRRILHLAWELDWSYGEIAQREGVTRTADYKVVKDFVASIRTRAVGAEVMDSLNPGQQLVKIVDEEMVHLLGERAPMT